MCFISTCVETFTYIDPLPSCFRVCFHHLIFPTSRERRDAAEVSAFPPEWLENFLLLGSKNDNFLSIVCSQQPPGIINCTVYVTGQRPLSWKWSRWPHWQNADLTDSEPHHSSPSIMYNILNRPGVWRGRCDRGTRPHSMAVLLLPGHMEKGKASGCHSKLSAFNLFQWS